MEQDQNTGGTPTPSSAPAENIMDTSTKSNLAPIFIGTIIVVAIIAIILGYMMMQSTSSMPIPTMDTVPATGTTVNADGSQAATPDAATVSLTTQGTSDDVADIDADLNATDLGSLDSSGI